jgi:hypothetical protein
MIQKLLALEDYSSIFGKAFEAWLSEQSSTEI